MPQPPTANPYEEILRDIYGASPPPQPLVPPTPLIGEEADPQFVTVRPPPPDENPYHAILAEDEAKRRAQLSQTLSQKAPPDQRASDLAIADRLGLPVQVVERNREVMTQRAQGLDDIVRSIAERSPGLGKWLTANPDQAPAARDDLPAMVKLENELEFGAWFVRAWDETQALYGRSVEATGDLLNSKKLRAYGQSVAEFNEQQSRDLGKPMMGLAEVQSPLDAVRLFKEAVLSNSVQIALSTGGAYAGGLIGGAVGTAALPFTGGASAVTIPTLVTVGSTIGAVIPSLMFGVGEVQRSIKEVDKTAQAPWSAYLGGAAIAALDSRLPLRLGSTFLKFFGREGAEHVSRTILAQTLKPTLGRAITKETLRDMVLEGITEGAQRGIQDLVVAGATTAEFDLQKTAAGMLEEAVIGGAVGGFYGGATAAATHGAESRQWVQAQQQKVIFDSLAAGATDSKLLQRVPSAFQGYVSGITKDGPLENLYVDADAFSTYWTEQGANPHLVAAQLTGREKALAHALDAGVRLSIPTANYATFVAATPHHKWFAEELSITENGASMRQAKENKAAEQQLHQQLAESIDKIARGEVELTDEKGGPVRQDFVRMTLADPAFVAMATSRGIDPEQFANTAAALNESIVTSLARAWGVDPVTLWREKAQAAIGQSARMSRQVAPGEATDQGQVTQVRDPAEAFLGGPDDEGPSATDEVSELGLEEGARPEDAIADADITSLEQAARLGTLREDLGDEDLTAVLGAMPEAPTIENEQLVSGGKRLPFTRVLAWLKDQDPAAIPPGPVRDATERAKLLAFPPPKPRDVPSLERAPSDVTPEGRRRMSSRVPTAVNAPPQPARLRTDFSVLELSRGTGTASKPDAYTKNAAWFRTLIQVSKEVQQTGTDAEVFEAFMARGRLNLRFLWDYMKPEWRERAKLWYIGAHRISHQIADEFGFSDQQAAALMAVLSPKVDWFKNVAYARKAAKFFTMAERDNPVFDRKTFEHYRKKTIHQFNTDGMKRLRDAGASAERIAQKRQELMDRLRRERGMYQGLTWHELDLKGQARLLRAYIETHQSAYDNGNYQIIMPEGEDAGVKRNQNTRTAKQKREGHPGTTGVPSKTGWTSYPITATAIAIMRDGKTENIQERLGGEHKVRSFYNNISDPWDPDSVTIDTHAVAAVHLQPFSSDSDEVKKTMSGFSDSMLGLSGANAVYAEVYFRLADELSAELGYRVLPREVQSVTWEAVRLLYPPSEKRTGAPDRAQAIWNDFAAGTITEAELYERHQNEPGRAAAPDWADHPARVAVDEGELRRGFGVPLAPDVPVRRGDRGGRPGGPPRRNAHVADGPTTLYQRSAGTAAFEPATGGVTRTSPVEQRRSAARSVLGQLSRSAARAYVRASRRTAQRVRGLAAVASWAPSLPLSHGFGKLGLPTPVIFELARTRDTAKAFHAKILGSKNASKFGAAVFVYSPEEYETFRLFLTEDGKSGLAIKPDGDIVSGFSAGGGYIHGLLALAVQEGGHKLDAFDTVLPDLYAVNGFKVVSRDSWNDQYTPYGWDKKTFAEFNNGEPDVVYMQYDPAALETGPTTLFQSAPAATGEQWAFSKLTRAVELSNTGKASGQQWKGIIRNAKIGINADEFLFAHVDDLVDKQTYTKQEVLDYLSVNQVQIEYTVLGAVDEVAIENLTQQKYDAAVQETIEEIEEADPTEPPYYEVREDNEGDWEIWINGQRHDSGFATQDQAIESAVSTVAFIEEEQARERRHQAAFEVSWSDAREAAIDELGMGGGVSEFATYVEPGADPGTYREVFLHSPSFGTTGFPVLTIAENNLLREHGHMGTIRNLMHGREGEAEAILDVNEELDDTLGNIDRVLKRQANFGNPAEVGRLNKMRSVIQKLRDTQDYRYVQSGWKDGHGQYAKINNPIVRLRFNTRTMPDGQKMLFIEELQAPLKPQFAKMPEILQKNWRELGMKWALAHAASTGHTMIGLTTGDMQQARYSLEKDVDYVDWKPQQEGEGGPAAEDASRRIDLHLKGGEGTLKLFVDNDMNVVHALLRNSEQEQFKGRSVEQLLGRDFVAEIQSKAIGSKQAKDVKVGGEGLKRSYDVDFPQVLNKLPAVKKNGGRVTTVQLPHGESITWEAEDQAIADAAWQPENQAPFTAPVPDEDRWDLGAAEDAFQAGDAAAGMAQAADTEARLRAEEAVQNQRARRTQIGMRIRELEGERLAQVEALTATGPGTAERWEVGEAIDRWEAVEGQELQTLLVALENENQKRVTAPKTTPVPGLQLTPEILAAVGQGQSYFQGDGQPAPPRGRIDFEKTAAGVRLATINMLSGADPSTIFHELGHLYLEMLGDITADLRLKDPTTLAPGQAGLVKDYEAILNWLGVAGRHEIGRDQHEQFARGFEAYLREGKAPSVELRGAFARFRTWMLGVYKKTEELQVTLTPEVRAVFDRMVAADDAVNEARNEADVIPFATAEQAGMTDHEFAVYRETAAKAHEQAQAAMQAKLFRELQQERTAFWKARRVAVQAEVEADVWGRREQIALSILTLGKLPSGAPAPPGAENLKISKDSIVEGFGKDRLKVLPKPWVYAVEGGVPVEQVAEVLGYASGEELLTDLAKTAKPETVVKEETAARMKAEVGDIRLDGTLQAQAKRAVQDHGMDAVLAMELRAIARKVRQVLPFVRQKVQAGDREARSALSGMQTALASMATTEQVRATAEERVAAMTVRELRPQLYWVAARNAGQAAFKAAATGRYEVALQEKIKQRLATAMYRAASDAVAEADATLKYAQRFTKEGPRARLGKAGDSYLDQVDALLDKFEFATVTNKALDRRQTLVAWVEARQKEGYEVQGIPAELMEAARRTNYRELSVEALRQVRDTIRQIDKMAGLKTRLLKNKDARDFAKVRDGLAAQLEAIRKPGVVLPSEYRQKDERRHAIKHFFAMHAKMSQLARMLDGYVDAGPFWRAIIRPLNDAANDEQTRRGEAGQAYGAIVDAHYPGKELRTWNTKVHVSDRVGSLSLEGRLAVALNWGNEISRDRLLTDPRRQYTEGDVEAILDTLSQNDWQFVQKTWDFIDTFWQEVSDKQQRVTGLRPEKVEAVTVMTKFGPLRGGYYPLAYDSRMSQRAGQVEKATEASLSMHAAYVTTTTRRGHTKSRVDHAELSIRLDLGVMFNHIDQVIHDLTHHETLIDVGRLLKDRAVGQQIIDIAGEPVYSQFTDGLEAIALGGKGAANQMDRAVVFLRTGTQVAAMGYNLWTAMQQPLGISNGAARIGSSWVARGLRRWMKDALTMEHTVAWIHDASPMMRARHLTATQDLADLRQQLQQPGGWFDTLVRTVTLDTAGQQNLMDSYLWHIGMAQRVADIPTWLGGYEKARAAGHEEELAIALADQGVLDSQGGGQIKDLAAVQRGPEVAKLFMLFYSYGNTMYNATSEVYGRAQLKTPLGMARFIADLSLLYVFPALATTTLAMLLGRDDDDEPYLLAVGKEMLSTAMNTMVLVREFGGLIKGGARGYEGPSGTRIFQLGYRVWTQLAQGEADGALWKALNAMAGILFKYPAGQVQRTIDGYIALEEGRTHNPFALLVGPPRE